MVLVHHASPSAGCDLASLLDLSSPGFIVEDSFLVRTSVLSSQSGEGDPSFAPAQVDLPHWEEEDGHNSNPVPWWALSLEGQSHPIWGGWGRSHQCNPNRVEPVPQSPLHGRRFLLEGFLAWP